MSYTIERKVGFFFLLAIIILGVMLEVGEKWNPFDRKVVYNTFLSSVTGLKVGDPVRLAGVNVGRIKGINVHDANVEIVFEVQKDTKIKTDTVASLKLTNLLGGQFLSLSFGSPGAPLLGEGKTVTGKDSPNIDVIVENVSDVIKDAKVLINDLNKNQNKVMNQLSDILGENRADIQGTIANFRSITTKIDQGDGTLAMLLNDKQLYTTMNDASTNINSVAAKINSGEGTLGKLVNDPSLYNDAKVAVADIKEGTNNMNASFKEIKDVANKINRGEGTIGKLVNDDAMYTDLKDTTKNLSEITRKINSGEGSLGKLVNEDKLYRDGTAALKKVEKAAEGISDSGPISILGSIIGTLF